MINDDMLLGAAVGWELAHEEICERGMICSAHQPISADAQQPRLVQALVNAILDKRPGLVLSAEVTRGVIESMREDLEESGRYEDLNFDE